MASCCVKVRNSDLAFCLVLGLPSLSLPSCHNQPPFPFHPQPPWPPTAEDVFHRHRVRVQVVMVILGTIAAQGLGYLQGGMVSIPNQGVHGRTHNLAPIYSGYSIIDQLYYVSHTLSVVCNTDLNGLLLCTGPESEPRLLPFLGSTTLPSPCIRPPITCSAPNRHGIPLLKIFFTRHRDRVRVVMGTSAPPGQKLHTKPQYTTERIGHRSRLPVTSKGDHLPSDALPWDQVCPLHGQSLPHL